MSDQQEITSLLAGILNDYKKNQGGSGAGQPAPEASMSQKAALHPLLEKMAAECEKRGASDIFISAGFPPSFKINGELTPVPLKPLTQQDTQVLVYSTMSSEQRSRFDHELELNYSATSKDGIRFRVNAYHEQGRMGMVWRRITTNILTVEAPDVVCVGEVRNEHTMEYALQLAQTGHLCMFTIHANNAVQAIERIMNFYPEERHQQVLMDLALNIVGIIGQRLARLKEGGRTAIVDLLINSPAMQDHIFKGELMECMELMNRSETDGMQTFDQDLFKLYTDGRITVDEALRQAESVNDLRLKIELWDKGNDKEAIYDRVSNLSLQK